MSEESLYFALAFLRTLIAVLSSGVVVGALAVRQLQRWFKRVVLGAYSSLDDGEEGARTPVPAFASLPPTSKQSRAAATESSPIVAVVVSQTSPRQNAILSLLFLISLSYLIGDGAIVVARAVISKEWEGRQDLWKVMEAYTLASGIAFALCALSLAWDRREGKLKGSWKAWYPIVLTWAVLCSEVSLLGVLGAVVKKQAHGQRPSVYTILHLTVLAVRVTLLSLLALHFTPALQRKLFVPTKIDESVDRLQVPNGAHYGTFNGEAAAETAPKLTEEPKKAEEKPPSTSFREFFHRIKILSPYLWPSKSKPLQFVAALCMILLGVGRAINLLVPLSFGALVGALSNREDPWFYLGAYVALRFMQGSGGILNVLQTNLWIPVAQFSDREMTLMSFNHLLNLSMSYHTRRKTGEVLRVLDRGSAINNFFQMLLFNIAPIFVDITIAVVYLAYKFGLLLAGLIFCVMIIYVGASVILTQIRVKMRRTMNDADKFCRSIHTDALLSVETVKYFTAEDYELDRYSRAMRAYQKEELKVLMSLSFLNLVQNFIISIGLMVGCLVVAYGVVQGTRNVSDFVTFVTYLVQLYAPLNSLGTLYRVIQSNLVDTEMLMKLLEEAAEIKDKPDAKELVVTQGLIEFENVSFSYDGKVPALTNVSFKIMAGQSAAFCGPSGGGKSTILRLLFRFYDVQSGSIKIDGTDIRDVTQKSLREAIGVIPQDSVLFNESIGYNIGYGRAGASVEEIVAAAKHAAIHDKIETFPDKYETKVGERGIRLSGGEKQRVSIARVMLKGAKIICLDEATSALDTSTEREIQDALHKVASGRTSLAIAHRLSTIIHSSKLFVVRDGTIAEEGTFHELIAKKGLFDELWRRQIEAEADAVEATQAADEAAGSKPADSSTGVDKAAAAH